jgi:hypothetical protein
VGGFFLWQNLRHALEQKVEAFAPAIRLLRENILSRDSEAVWFQEFRQLNASRTSVVYRKIGCLCLDEVEASKMLRSSLENQKLRALHVHHQGIVGARVTSENVVEGFRYKVYLFVELKVGPDFTPLGELEYGRRFPTVGGNVEYE